MSIKFFCVLKMTLKRAKYCNVFENRDTQKKKQLEFYLRMVAQKRSDMVIRYRTNTKLTPGK